MKTQLWSKCCISYFRQREFCRVPSSTQVNWELDIKGEIQRDICPVAWGTDQNTAWEGSREVNPSCSLETALKMAFVWQRISFTNPKLVGHCGSEKMPIEMGNGSCFCFLYIKLFSETFKWPSHGYWTFYHLLTFKYTNGCPKEPPHIAKEISSINHLLIERLKKETKYVDEHQIFFTVKVWKTCYEFWLKYHLFLPFSPPKQNTAHGPNLVPSDVKANTSWLHPRRFSRSICWHQNGNQVLNLMWFRYLI